jgi:hypothetical protein
MDGNKKFRSRALIVKTALRFITKSRRKSLFPTDENPSCESLSSPISQIYTPNLSKDSYSRQEKYQKRKLFISTRTNTMTSINHYNK